MDNMYKKVCGSAFEDLSKDELMQYDGGAFITALSTTTWPCVGASAIISGCIAISACAVGKFKKR